MPTAEAQLSHQNEARVADKRRSRITYQGNIFTRLQVGIQRIHPARLVMFMQRQHGRINP